MKNLNNIQDSGFKAPKDYINSLEDTILNSVQEDNLKDRVSSGGMKVPDGYFENLEDTLLKTVSDNNLQPKVISLWNKRNLMFASGIAAAMVIMFSVFFNNDTTTFESIDLELVENYILDQNIDSFELASLLKDDDLTIDAFIDSDMYGESLENYLLENTDFEDLIIE